MLCFNNFAIGWFPYTRKYYTKGLVQHLFWPAFLCNSSSTVFKFKIPAKKLSSRESGWCTRLSPGRGLLSHEMVEATFDFYFIFDSRYELTSSISSEESTKQCRLPSLSPSLCVNHWLFFMHNIEAWLKNGKLWVLNSRNCRSKNLL